MKERVILEVMDYLRLIVMVVVITTVLNTLLFTFSTVQQSSMENTLHQGDVLVIEKIGYLFGQPQAGDIIVFVEDEAVVDNYLVRLKVLFQDIQAKFTRDPMRIRLVKRVIGLPGDVIDINGGDVYVNGQVLNEPYVENPTVEKVVEYPYTVPDGYYFVMGDHRNVSKDSRHFGAVPKENIEGKAIFRLSPLKVIGRVR